MRSTREATELRQYFQIKTDLSAAVSGATAGDIDFYLNELATMQMHTTSDRLRRACRAAIGGFAKPIEAIQA